MPATVQIVEKNGAGGTTTDKTSGTIRFKNADNATVDNNNRLVVPTSGSEWSFQKWLRLNVTVAPSVDLQNFKAYSDGSSGFGTGINLWGKVVGSYSTPAEETANTGYSDFFSKTSGSAYDLGAGPFTGTGEKGDHLVLAMEVLSTAGPGSLSAETITFSYDET